jgi:hypothetical protein
MKGFTVIHDVNIQQWNHKTYFPLGDQVISKVTRFTPRPDHRLSSFLILTRVNVGSETCSTYNQILLILFDHFPSPSSSATRRCEYGFCNKYSLWTEQSRRLPSRPIELYNRPHISQYNPHSLLQHLRACHGCEHNITPFHLQCIRSKQQVPLKRSCPSIRLHSVTSEKDGDFLTHWFLLPLSEDADST